MSRRRRAVLLRLIHAPVWVALCRARAAVESVLKRDAHGAVITAQVPVAVLELNSQKGYTDVEFVLRMARAESVACLTMVQ